MWSVYAKLPVSRIKHQQAKKVRRRPTKLFYASRSFPQSFVPYRLVSRSLHSMSFRACLPVSLPFICCMTLLLPATAYPAEALVEFVESRGCRVLASVRSATRLKEIAAQGSVTWDGECRNGLIDGPGVLRHQGSARENDRTRHYAFYLSGNAIAGKRIGPWRRESFNKFADSDQYWTSVTSIPYVDGVARDPLRQIAIRSDADFSASFRELLRAIDRKPDSAKANTGGGSAGSLASAPEPLPAAGANAALAPASPGAHAPVMAPSATTAVAPAATLSANRADRPVPAPESSDEQARLRADSLNPYGAVAMWLAQISQATTREPKAIEASAGCVVETINEARVGTGAIAVNATAPLQIAGRVADPGRAPNMHRAWIRFVNSGGGPAVVVDIPRASAVAEGPAATADATNLNSSFRVALAAGRLPKGEYIVSVVQQRGNEFSVCGTAGKLRVG